VTSSLKRGGAEAVLFNIITQSSQQFEHQVIYVHGGPYVEQLREQGVQLYQAKGLVFRYDPFFIFRLFMLIKKLKPDCIHSLLWVANVSTRLVARLLGIPHVSAVHNNVDQDGYVRNALDRYTLPIAGAVVAVSLEVASGVKKLCSTAAVQVIPNGIDSSMVQKKAEMAQIQREDFGLRPEHFVIGSVGRYEAVKNYSLLLDSFALVYKAAPQARLMLVGHGSQESFLKKKAGNLGISHLVTFIVGQQSYGYYPLFDCFVLASPKEGVSIALLEALSCKLPCAVTALTRMHPVLVHGKTGLLVRAESVTDLQRAILDLMHDPERAKRLGVAGNQAVSDRFALANMVNAYERTFLKLLNRN
jgi:glycosyltransferase involved in cell wall biosynthesis